MATVIRGCQGGRGGCHGNGGDSSLQVTKESLFTRVHYLLNKEAQKGSKHRITTQYGTEHDERMNSSVFTKLEGTETKKVNF